MAKEEVVLLTVEFLVVVALREDGEEAPTVPRRRLTLVEVDVVGEEVLGMAMKVSEPMVDALKLAIVVYEKYETWEPVGTPKLIDELIDCVPESITSDAVWVWAWISVARSRVRGREKSMFEECILTLFEFARTNYEQRKRQ